MLSIYKNKRVLVTGHTGFKGSWLCAVLKEAGALVAGYSLQANTILNHYELLNLDIDSTIGDINDLKYLKDKINDFQPQIIFHLAAQPLVRESYRDPITTYKANVIGTLNLLEAIRECNSVRALVAITTDKVYENKEWEYPYRENDELGGYDLYSSSKACCEVLIKSYQRSFFNLNTYKKEHQLLIASTRAGNVIGGGDWNQDRLIPDIVKATSAGEDVFVRNPSAVRPWQHVLDCLYGYLLVGEKLLQEEEDFSGSWNFAPYSFESKTVEEIANLSKEIWPEVNIRFGTPQDNYHEAGLLKLDNSKAVSKLLWKPKWNTVKAVKKTIEWYKEYYNNGTIQTQKDIIEYFRNEIY